MLFFKSLIFLVIKADSVLHELTDRDFDAKLKGKNAFIMFYSPTCGHCQRLKPTFESLSLQKSIGVSGVVVGKVDCTENGKNTCQKYSVSGYPTLKFISRIETPEAVFEYSGNRELQDIERFVLDHNREALVEVHEEKLSEFIESTTLPVIIGFFKDAKSKLFLKLKELSATHKIHYIIGYTLSATGAKKLGQKQDSVVLYRQKQYLTPLDSAPLVCYSDRDLSTFLTKSKYSIVEYRIPENQEEFQMPMITAFIAIDPLLQKSSAKRLRNVMVKLALKEKDITFTISKASDYASFLTDVGKEIKNKDVLLVAFDKDEHKYFGREVANCEDHKQFDEILSKFTADFKRGNVLERFVKSEPIPTEDDGNVKVVVAKNFDEVVVNNDNDVLIEFYAPWCGHCKKLTPIYQQIATLLKDEPKLIIAKYDATSNEQQKNFDVKGFPTIYLAKSGMKTSPVQYNGKRDAASMIEWLRKEARHKIKFSGEVPEFKEEL